MGLFLDTARDARRPLSGAWVRRAADLEIPEESYSEPAAPSGMDTVFRFQKAESPVSAGMLHGASSRTGGRGNNAIPSGDPLFAGREAGRPKPSATQVKGNDDSRQGNSEASELETGQEILSTERKSDAVVNPAPMARHSMYQSEVMPETLGLDSWTMANQTEVLDGNGNTVNNQREKSLSRLPGRGALPSETSPAQAMRSANVAAAANLAAPAPASGPAPAEDRQPARGLADNPAAPLPHVAAPETRGRTEHAAPAPGRPRAPAPASAAVSALAPLPGHARAAPPEAPGLVIGRIDVVVVAEAPSAAAPARGRDDAGFLSRNYLKRL